MHIIEEWLASIAKGYTFHIQEDGSVLGRDNVGPYIVCIHHRYSRLLCLSRNKKNGAPTRAVKTPTGSTAGAMTTRARRSASVRKMAPPSAEVGRSKRWRGPSNRRIV